MLSLAEFRLKAKGLPDYLPWAALIDNGIVLTKAGGLMAAWEYAGPDVLRQCAAGGIPDRSAVGDTTVREVRDGR